MGHLDEILVLFYTVHLGKVWLLSNKVSPVCLWVNNRLQKHGAEDVGLIRLECRALRCRARLEPCVESRVLRSVSALSPGLFDGSGHWMPVAVDIQWLARRCPSPQSNADPPVTHPDPAVSSRGRVASDLWASGSGREGRRATVRSADGTEHVQRVPQLRFHQLIFCQHLLMSDFR